MRIQLIITFLVIASAGFGQQGTFEGIVYGEDRKKLVGARIVFTASCDTVITDQNGYFSASRPEQSDLKVEVSMEGYRTEDQYISRTDVNIRGNRIFLCKLCKYDSSGRVCPICRRSDKVLDIVYGLPMWPLQKGVHYAGYCDVTCCDPRYYCSRDKKEF